MQCARPFEVKKKFYPYPVRVACGQCMPCRVNRTREWTFRLLAELPYHDGSSYISWTYDEEHLPCGGGLVKKHIQDAFKRLRKPLTKKIKYFTTGEYGEDSNRAHYHSIVFGLSHRDIRDNDIFGVQIVRKGSESIYQGGSVWPMGGVHVGTVTSDSIFYVTGYIRKKLNGKKGKEFYGNRTPPFQLQSLGLGLRWAEDNLEYLQQNLHVTMKGSKLGMPRYFKKKFWFDERRMMDLASEAEIEFLKECDERGVSPEAIRYQREKNYEARLAMKKNKL